MIEWFLRLFRFDVDLGIYRRLMKIRADSTAFNVSGWLWSDHIFNWIINLVILLMDISITLKFYLQTFRRKYRFVWNLSEKHAHKNKNEILNRSYFPSTNDVFNRSSASSSYRCGHITISYVATLLFGTCCLRTVKMLTRYRHHVCILKFLAFWRFYTLRSSVRLRSNLFIFHTKY